VSQQIDARPYLCRIRRTNLTFVSEPVAVELLPARSWPGRSPLPPVGGDDTTYVWYVASALVVELVGGPAIGVLMYLARSGVDSSHLAVLVQAHGSLQLLGWSGLFVAGMAQRLVPRLAGRPPVREAALPLLGLLAGGAVLRAVGQVIGNAPGGTLALVGSLLSAVGILWVAVLLAVTLRKRRSPMAGWVVFAWSGCAWWGVWAVLEASGGVLGASRGGLVPAWLDEPAVLIITLGAIGSFIWAIQSRMVPIFFGRKQPTVRALAGPAVLYNLGLLVILLTLVITAAGQGDGPGGSIADAGFALVGVGVIWLAAGTGAVTGVPHRLRAASRPLARFVVSADRWAIVAGLMWIAAYAAPLVYPATPRQNFADAALHAFGTGVITMLIAGMVQMVAPVFARARIEGGPTGLVERSVWPLLWGATAARVAAALAGGYAFTILAALSGVLGWAGLAALAGLLVAAGRRNLRTDTPVSAPTSD
jgi:hypothetical protein